MLRSQLASPTLLHALDTSTVTHSAHALGRQLQRPTHGLGFGDALGLPASASGLRSPFRTPASPILGSLASSGSLAPGSPTLSSPRSVGTRMSMTAVVVASPTFASPTSPSMMSPSPSIGHGMLSPRLLFPQAVNAPASSSPLALRQSPARLDCNGGYDSTFEEDITESSIAEALLKSIVSPPPAPRQKPTLCLDTDFMHTFGPFVPAPTARDSSKPAGTFSPLPEPSPFNLAAPFQGAQPRHVTFSLKLPKRTDDEGGALSRSGSLLKTPFHEEGNTVLVSILDGPSRGGQTNGKVSFANFPGTDLSTLDLRAGVRNRPRTPFPLRDSEQARATSLSKGRSASGTARKVSFAVAEDDSGLRPVESQAKDHPLTPYRPFAPPSALSSQPTIQASQGVLSHASGPSVPHTLAHGSLASPAHRATVPVGAGIASPRASPALPPRACTLGTPELSPSPSFSTSNGRPRAAEAILKLSRAPAPRKFSFSTSPAMASGSPRFSDVCEPGTPPSLRSSPRMVGSPALGAAARKASGAGAVGQGVRGNIVRRMSMSETPFRGVESALPPVAASPRLPSSPATRILGGRRVASLVARVGSKSNARKVSFTDVEMGLGIMDTKLRARPRTPFRETATPAVTTPGVAGRRCVSFAEAQVRKNNGSYFPVFGTGGKVEGREAEKGIVESPDEIDDGEGKDDGNVPGLVLVDAEGIEGKVRTWSEAQGGASVKHVGERVSTPFAW